MKEKKNYFDRIEYMLKNESEFGWDYYHCHGSCENVEDVFHYPNSFVDNTFIHAKKQLLLSTNHNDPYSFYGPNISQARAAHSVSSFFTGMILGQGLLGDNLERFCQLYRTSNGIFPFSYVWNLTCLYHDFGYEFENDAYRCEIVKNKMNRSEERIPANIRRIEFPEFDGCSLLAVSREFSINKSYLPLGRYGWFNKEDSAEVRFINQYIRNWKDDMLCNGRPVKIPYRSGMKIERYLNYRLFGNGQGCLDHGIMGGLSFFNLIIDNYINEYLMNRDTLRNQDFTNFEVTNLLGNPLQISIEQTILFAYIADCIINHNIWKCQKGSENDYKKFGLNDLIGYKFEKIDFYKNPLLFLLVMGDCLEPYKNYCRKVCGHGIDDLDYSKDEVMSIFKNYNLTVKDNRIVITVPDGWVTACEEKLSDMKEWIAIKYLKKANTFYITPTTIVR